MRYSKGAATLLSTVFTFRVKTVNADVFDDSSNQLLPVTDTATNGLTVTPTSGPTPPTIKRDRKPVDTGILNLTDTATKGTDVIASSSGITITSTCDTFVTCKNGLDTSDPTGGTSCYYSCVGTTGAPLCCAYDDGTGTYFDACSGFTGKVCKDGKSCNGKEACQDATIKFVVNSCIGDYACLKAGFNGGSIGNVYDSCEGQEACDELGTFNGKVGNIINSCKKSSACQHAATNGGIIESITNSCNGMGACVNTGDNNGRVGNVLNSCNDVSACFGAASGNGLIGSISDSCNEGSGACRVLGSAYGIIGNVLNSCKGYYACNSGALMGGAIGNITASCKGERACDGLGRDVGTVGSINNACTSAKSCFHGGGLGGVIGNIETSCTADDSCRDLGQTRGKVGHLTNSCTGKFSCQDAGSKRGSIGSISQSCKAAYACDGAGSGSSGAITSNLMNCCNNVNECKDALKTLPANCKAPTTSKPKPPPASKVSENVMFVCNSKIDNYPMCLIVFFNFISALAVGEAFKADDLVQQEVDEYGSAR